MAYDMAMTVANIAELKNQLSRFLAEVEKGKKVEVRRRNVPIARILPVSGQASNRTVLGCGKGTVTIKGDVTEPLFPLTTGK